MLCSILQTNSLQTVQAWIDQATDEGGYFPFPSQVAFLMFVIRFQVSFKYHPPLNITVSLTKQRKSELTILYLFVGFGEKISGHYRNAFKVQLSLISHVYMDIFLIFSVL